MSITKKIGISPKENEVTPAPKMKYLRGVSKEVHLIKSKRQRYLMSVIIQFRLLPTALNMGQLLCSLSRPWISLSSDHWGFLIILMEILRLFRRRGTGRPFARCLLGIIISRLLINHLGYP